MVWPASSAARRFRSPGGARSASLSPGLASSVPRPRLHEVGASSCAAARRRASTLRATCGGLGKRKRVDPGLPDVAPGAEGEGRGDGLPCGAGVEVREFEGDAKGADGPVGNAELTGDRGPITTVVAAHMRDAGANPRLRRPRAPSFIACTVSGLAVHHRRLTRAQLRHRRRVHYFVLSFIRLRIAEQDTAGRAESARACSQHPRVRAHRIPTSWVRGRESPRWSWNP